jgi:hypothetical protein
MKIKKIKYSKDITTIEYSEIHNDIIYHHSVSSNEEPMSSFIAAIDNNVKTFAKILELPIEERVTLHTFNFQHKESNEAISVIISGNIKLNNSAGSFNVNTPLRYIKGEGELVLNDEEVENLNELMNEAEKYVNGTVSQPSLFQINEAV